MKPAKEKAWDEANNDIIAFEDAGFSVVRHSELHWFIANRLHVWPSARKYMFQDPGGTQGKAQKYDRLTDLLPLLQNAAMSEAMRGI